MLAPWIIEKEKDRQRREDQASWDRQPRLHIEAPRPMGDERPKGVDESTPRGSVDIDFNV
jgi:hypothetical protein